jgi:peptidoglycan/LPS O-acetylase OafA/YrhL
MKKSRRSKTTSSQNDRILFFDLLRIGFVALIVYGHSQFNVIPWLNSILFSDGFAPFNIYPLGLTGLSVYGMIFVSGAVIEYNYKGIEHVSDYVKFMFKRFIRLYPAFWMSLFFGLLVFPIVLKAGIFNIIFEFTGFYVILGQGLGIINKMGWFIAAIMSLYLLFPYLTKIVRKYQFSAIVAFMLISFFIRFLLLTYNVVPLDHFYRWFPLCNLFEFGLGIYIIQTKLYPRDMTSHPTIRQLSDLSYYVFLFHWIVITALFYYTVNGVQIFYFCKILELYSYPVINNTIDYCVMIALVLLVSWTAMMLDKKIQQKISASDAMKTFMNS